MISILKQDDWLIKKSKKEIIKGKVGFKDKEDTQN